MSERLAQGLRAVCSLVLGGPAATRRARPQPRGSERRHCLSQFLAMLHQALCCLPHGLRSESHLGGQRRAAGGWPWTFSIRGHMIVRPSSGSAASSGWAQSPGRLEPHLGKNFITVQHIRDRELRRRTARRGQDSGGDQHRGIRLHLRAPTALLRTPAAARALDCPYEKLRGPPE